MDVPRPGQDRHCDTAAARLPRGRRLCAGGGVDGVGPALWADRRSRQDRRRVVGRARDLPRCRGVDRACEPARSGRARRLRRARGRDARDRLANGRGGRGGPGRGRARNSGDRALGARPRRRAVCPAVGSGGGGGAGAAEGRCRMASRARRGLRGAVRRRRLSGAGTLGAGDRSDAVVRIGGARADRHPRRALLSHRQIRALDPVRGGRLGARRALCAGDRKAGQAAAPSRNCGGGRDVRDRRGRGAGAWRSP